MADDLSKKRTRTWNIVLYPDSAPDNWRELIDEWQIQWVESPLHDSDVNADGEVKKPHWHVMLCFDSVKSFDQVRDLTESLNCPRPQICNSMKGSVRYMSHMDNPEKAQYDQSKVIAHGGLDLWNLMKPSSSERYVFIGEMMAFVDEYDCTEFSDLLAWARHNRPEDWFPLLCDSCAFVMDKYITSRRNKRHADRQKESEEVMQNVGVR